MAMSNRAKTGKQLQLRSSTGTLQKRAILTAVYSTGMRRSELVRLRVEDIDSERMVIHIRKGKGARTVICRFSPGFSKLSANTG
jgi:site-specific recombinase XerD